MEEVPKDQGRQEALVRGTQQSIDHITEMKFRRAYLFNNTRQKDSSPMSRGIMKKEPVKNALHT